MKLLQMLVCAASCTTVVFGQGQRGRDRNESSIDAINPFRGYDQFVSPKYRDQVSRAALQLTRERKFDLAQKAWKVTQIPTFLWLDEIAAIRNLEGWLREASIVQTVTRKKQIVPLVVYDLPDLVGSAKASAGELKLSENGEERYRKDFIDPIVRILKKYPHLRFAIQLETDAVGNLVTNLAVEKCANAADAQKRSMSYAIAQLQLPNVAIYLDGAHAGWLGWPDNLSPTADIIEELIVEARKINSRATVRGIATNVSNFNGLGNNEQPGRDELKYVRDLAPLLAAKGINVHFIVDQGRSGNQEAQREGGDWCNFKHAGFGPRPSTNTPDPLVDAIVWVKPGGEADGTSDETAERYDEACGSETSLKPAPEAGSWFQAYFELLLIQANPPL